MNFFHLSVQGVLPIFLGPPVNSLALLGGGLMAFILDGIPSLSRIFPAPPLAAQRGPPALPGPVPPPGLMASWGPLGPLACSTGSTRRRFFGNFALAFEIKQTKMKLNQISHFSQTTINHFKVNNKKMTAGGRD